MNDQPKNPADAEREIFLEALQCESPEKRGPFLDRACVGNPAIRMAVETLLKHHNADEFMQPPGLKTGPPTALEKPGDRIGRYKLLQQIGEGGCGVVYMAEQIEPVRRQVALKVIKLGMDTKNVIARFEAEKQTLALMDHRNIAKVFDAGATDSGRPYFVMELVRGVKITEYCDKNHLATRERLYLFIQVCQAIQHAHQKGVIHRDIKPSNILVTMHDGVAVPMVIDFGIAKATQQRLTDKTLFTAFEQFIGTPAYMSPEQAEMSALGIDTRSDIYSLGILLYELLTGTTPFDSKKLVEAGLDEIRRIIREEEPARPSTRLDTMTAADLTEAAKLRGVEPSQLSGFLRADLDWIVMKALEKDRVRRYETASALVEDISHFLSDEPIAARPPSSLYRFQKTVRRNKLAVAAAITVAASLVIGLSVSASLFFKERAAHRRAVAAEQEQTQLRLQAESRRDEEAKLRAIAEEDEKKAEAEALRSTQIQGFMSSLLEDVTHMVASQRNNADLEETMENAVARARKELKDQPLVAASVLLCVADAYVRLSDDEKASAMYKEVLRLLQASPDHTVELLWPAVNGCAHALLRQKHFVEAEKLLGDTISRAPKFVPAQRIEIQSLSRLWTSLSDVQMAQKKLTEAEASLLEWRKLQTKIGEDGFSRTITSIQEQLGQLDEAESSWREHVQAGRDKTNSSSYKWRLNEFGDFLLRRGKYAEAADFLVELGKNWLDGVGNLDRPNFQYMLGRSCGKVAWACYQAGDKVRASRVAEEGVQLFNDFFKEDRQGFNTRNLPDARSLLGENLIAKAAANITESPLDRLAVLRLAEPLVRSEVNGAEYLPGAFGEQVYHGMLLCQRLYSLWDEFAPSEEKASLAIQWRQRAADWIDPTLPYNRAQALRYEGQFAEAEILLRQVVLQEKSEGTNVTPRLVRSLLDLADVLAAENEHEWNIQLLLGGSKTRARGNQFEESIQLLLHALPAVDQCQPPVPGFHDAVMSEVNRLSRAIGNGAALTTNGFEAYHVLLKLTADSTDEAACFQNLRTIAAAKQQWALENIKQPGDTPTGKELWGLHKYIPAGEPKCPAGGVYLIGSLIEAPSCSVHGTPP